MTVELRFMPCAEFELALHEYVDGEISSADSQGLLVHLELCEQCSDAVEMIRNQVRVHREAIDAEHFLADFDQQGFFANLNARLITTHLDRLSDLFYELGKAYFLSGNDSKITIFLKKKGQSIERLKGEGRQVLKEARSVAERAGTVPRRTRQSLRRADHLFRGRGEASDARPARRVGARTALDNARRYLEESLILDPGQAKARYYLGLYFHRVDRPDEAMGEYRKLLAIPDLEPSLRAFALQAMGNAWCYRREYGEAIRCYEQILEERLVDGDARFFHVLVGLAMHHAKAGNFDRSKEVFGELVARHPQRLEDARRLLGQAEVFRALLAEHEAFRTELLDRYPVLFAG